jgi:hypothetical protein
MEAGISALAQADARPKAPSVEFIRTIPPVDSHRAEACPCFRYLLREIVTNASSFAVPPASAQADARPKAPSVEFIRTTPPADSH